MSTAALLTLVRSGGNQVRRRVLLRARSLQDDRWVTPTCHSSTSEPRWSRFDPDGSGRPATWDNFGIWDNRLEEPILLPPSIKYGKPIPKVSLQNVGSASQIGKRKENEDRFGFAQLTNEVLYFAVYDGHGGPAAADFCHTHMEKCILDLLPKEENLETVLTLAFLEIDKTFARHAHLSADATLLTSGTTATVALLRDGIELVIASVGDSRAILCRKGKPMKLTIDHTPERKDEKERIKKCGGFVAWNSLGQPHVNGRLAMTRSLGDLDLKTSLARVGAADLSFASLLAELRSSQVRWSTRKWLCCSPWVFYGSCSGVVKGERPHPASSTYPETTMTKGRAVERSQTEALHSTPPGNKATGTRGPSTPSSRDHLKEKACAEAGSARMSLLILVSIFLSAAFVMFLVYKNFPQLSEEERMNMKVPRDMDDAKALGKVLSKYKDTFYVQVLVAYFATYIFLQTFAIPGSIFLSILSGFLYPFPLALFLVCLCSGLGASFCYMLSYLVGRPVVYKYLTEKAVKWSQQVERHREHLINYIIFLRITPFLPNWFINITSPVINVPLKVFFIGTFLGVAPPSFVAIKAGTTLYQLTTAGEAVSWNSVFVLMILALLSILPAIFQKKLKQKFE